MNIDKDLKPNEEQVRKFVARGLTPEEATRLLQIRTYPGWNPRREHKEVTERLIRFHETLRLVDPIGLDELGHATKREDQWTVVNFYVFREVIQNLSRTDTLVLAKYCLWVFHTTEFEPVIEAPKPEATFGSLETAFNGIVLKE